VFGCARRAKTVPGLEACLVSIAVSSRTPFDLAHPDHRFAQHSAWETLLVDAGGSLPCLVVSAIPPADRRTVQQLRAILGCILFVSRFFPTSALVLCPVHAHGMVETRESVLERSSVGRSIPALDGRGMF
jgi:hypothetical protein